MFVHLSDWAGQPDVRILCDQSYGLGGWRPKVSEGVFERDDGAIYTFEDNKVTCPACHAAMFATE